MAALIKFGVAVACSALSGATASAAPMEYCERYAREYADVLEHASRLVEYADEAGEPGFSADRIQHLYERAYAKCLNQEGEPALPSAMAGDQSAAIGEPANATGIGEGDAEEGLSDPPAKSQPAAKGPSGRHQGSGFQAWTKEWAAWCSAHYRSFDPKTGYVKPFSGKPTLCQ